MCYVSPFTVVQTKVFSVGASRGGGSRQAGASLGVGLREEAYQDAFRGEAYLEASCPAYQEEAFPSAAFRGEASYPGAGARLLAEHLLADNS
mmetsp:Transcript_29810/g.65145  ORF Transcript_29810/g.65145 Transcript_29810/m.65145 type:complete len:92 (+) Transcript_29810:84-359(+)